MRWWSRPSRLAPRSPCRSTTCSGATATAGSGIPSGMSGRSQPTLRTSSPRRWSAAGERPWRARADSGAYGVPAFVERSSPASAEGSRRIAAPRAECLSRPSPVLAVGCGSREPLERTLYRRLAAHRRLKRCRWPTEAGQGGSVSAIDELVEANRHFAEAAGKIEDPPLPPRRGVAILTCMDARIVPARIFGLEEGDAHVIRNAGGLAREGLRSLVISRAFSERAP